MRCIALVLLSLLSFQLIAADVQEETLSGRGVGDEITKIINAMMGLVKSTLGKILEVVDAGITKIKNIAQDGIKLVNDGINGMLDAINALEKKALDLGVDITECIFGQREKIEEMRIQTIGNLNATAGHIIDSLDKIKGKASDKVNQYLNVVETLLKDFKGCSIINLVCLGNVLVKATNTSIKLTSELPALAASVAKDVAEMVFTGVNDLGTITKGFTSASVSTMKSIVDCAREKGVN